LKICLTGGIGTPREAPADKQMTDEEVAAVVEVAHTAGKRVASHTGGDQAIADAVRLGVDCIEHGCSFGDETAASMAKAATYLVPTLCVTRNSTTCAPRRAGVDAVEGQGGRCRHLASIRRAVAYGVTLCCGTDLLPSDPVDGTVATVREVELLVECGLTPMQAIQAATINSAKLCGTDHEVGTLEPGKLADLLVVEGRPDEQIRDLREIRLVMKGGPFRRQVAPGPRARVAHGRGALRRTFARSGSPQGFGSIATLAVMFQ
jgi:imidazolonepropionase-like amidohydrolase